MTTSYFTSPDGRRLAYRASAPTGSPLTFVWLSGFKSDMSGTKVTELEAWARTAGHGFLAFDYSGHGESDGAFEDGTISAWRADALAAIDAALPVGWAHGDRYSDAQWVGPEKYC